MNFLLFQENKMENFCFCFFFFLVLGCFVIWVFSDFSGFCLFGFEGDLGCSIYTAPAAAGWEQPWFRGWSRLSLLWRFWKDSQWSHQSSVRTPWLFLLSFSCFWKQRWWRVRKTTHHFHFVGRQSLERNHLYGVKNTLFRDSLLNKFYFSEK